MNEVKKQKSCTSRIIKSNKSEEGSQGIRGLILRTVWLVIRGTLILWFTLFSGSQDLAAQVTINWPKISLTKKAGGLSQPVYITHAGDGSGRLFVVEQQGRIRVIKNGVLLNTPFLNIVDRVSCCFQRGLLSVAFPPNYASKGYFYVAYTNNNGDSVVARYDVTANPDVADPNSEEFVLIDDQPTANHNIGQLAFGPDGYLYIGKGDGHIGDPNNNAQNPGLLHGKILRIDVESAPIPPDPYVIPSDNPYINESGYRDEIWALGLRNPWRFSFDRQIGDLYIGDTGQHKFEEVDFQLASSPGGENYGWRIMEGTQCYNSTECDQTGLELPVFEYEHPPDSTPDCNSGAAIIGGFVYRGTIYPRMQGVYFFGDFCNGQIRGLKHDGTAWQNTILSDTPYAISSFGEDEAGNLYIADIANGGIYIITDTFCNGLPATIVGTGGSDVLNGTAGADIINGLGGNDIISGLGGNDRICGGSGNDTLNGNNGNDRLFGQQGGDTLKGGNGNDTLKGDSGDDTLDGGANTDTCDGGSQNDTATNCETVTNIP